jgi:hypothetical protein
LAPHLTQHFFLDVGHRVLAGGILDVRRLISS